MPSPGPAPSTFWPVIVVFRKQKRDLCLWTAFPEKRRPISAVGGGGFRCLPHDLGQLVVEKELGHRYGFWGCLADGATFRSVARGGGPKRTPRGTQLIASHVVELDAAEHDAVAHTTAWREGRPTPLADALTAVHQAWLAVAEHDELTLDFPTPRRLRTR